MSFNPKDEKQVARLSNLMDRSREMMRPFREQRIEFIRQYCGARYGENAAPKEVPINLMMLAANIFVRHLVSQRPRVLVNTPHRLLKPNAAWLEVALSQLLEEIRIVDTFQTVAFDALMGMGIAKYGIRYAGSEEIGGYLHDFAQPYCDPVLLDDFVFDMRADRIDQCMFMGDRYEAPLEFLKSSDLYDGKELDNLETRLLLTNEQGDQRSRSLSIGEEIEQDWNPVVDLWDVWLPAENMLVTFAAANTGRGTVQRKPLRVVEEWEGPEEGPYGLLRFHEVPGNLMPVPPAAWWMPIHEMANVLMRKLKKQAERQKTILGVQPGQMEQDGLNLLNADDGDVIPVFNPNNAREYRFGGADQVTLAFTVYLKDLFSYLGGGLEIIGGLSPMSETLGQDQMLMASASRQVAQMQDKMLTFVRRTCYALSWYEYTDPVRRRLIERKVPGLDVTVSVNWGPEMREADFLQFDFDIDPYSMQHQTPETRLQSIMQIWNGIVLPALPSIQQQGDTVSIRALLNLIAKYKNLPELEDLVIPGTPPEETSPEASRTRKSPVSKRIYERVNRPGVTARGKDHALMQSLLGKGLQDGQKRSLMQPVS